MEIKLTISTHTLGDDNTEMDNQRYAEAVQAKLKTEYPDADVSVELTNNVTASSCQVSNDPTEEIKENVNLIANQVWDKADY